MATKYQINRSYTECKVRFKELQEATQKYNAKEIDEEEYARAREAHKSVVREYHRLTKI